ncbi:LtfC-like domain-containing protein [Mycobacteroides abscessus]|uniref:LtfC-like domain-containing protein n=1 Tax=Mycobacteroides abscessus TaxID=36809 RepID=UPI00092B7684|nr:hypothetical protein [Mycobacteroides abscessus]DAZ90367.1 TPA_asm: hypothetical protein PROPHIFSQJ01-1_81 [Mycobacterium phage prophiFSQJ01-1]SII41780.1 Uncharacterised protein [Mycobacteroides abscessus subsp. abscessus]SIK13324.1 Uncharacterised protein [Mycobacteroides abscessus subsp. abscessus]SIN25856.1 Uncharacterised protein [Mycobacteroides abscessus subsp. abscessus]SLI51098.1 Uncharacterised protein [Mycobacteroides abscessus subsp. abscessus]
MIGNVAIVDRINLIQGQDLAHRWDVPEGDELPAGTTVTLYIYSHNFSETLGVWPAIDVDPQGASFFVQSSDLDPIPMGARFRVYITYPAAPHPRLVWVLGSISRQG